MRNVAAWSIGSLAARRLACESRTATVIGAGARAVYVRDEGGEILWVASPGSPPHRRGVVASLPQPGWTAGTELAVRNGELSSKDGRGVALAGVPVWSSPSIDWTQARPEGASGALQAGLAVLLQVAAPQGWAAPVLMGEWGDLESTDVAAGSIARLAAARWARDTRGMLEASEGLVGLGGGLTPSGDDFLGGLWFALRLLDSGQEIPSFDWADVERSTANALSRTTAISGCILSDLVLGHGPAPLHDVVIAALAGAAPGDVAEGVSRLVAIGHTSGWDLFAGVALALDESLARQQRDWRKEALGAGPGSASGRATNAASAT